MATSRTGTASHKRFRTAVLHAGQSAGITQCPCTLNCPHHTGRTCAVILDYQVGRKPNSAEPDHIIPHARGGTDHPDNGRVLCRRCNQHRGDGREPRLKPTATTTTTLVRW